MKRFLLFLAACCLAGTTQAQSTGDPLTDAINAVRASYGLHALVYDGNLAAWAAQNNLYGFGHAVMGPAVRQNAAWGTLAVDAVVPMWMNSAPHRAAILDPMVTASGGAVTTNGIWTWNAGYAAIVTPVTYVQTPPEPTLQVTTTATPQAPPKTTPQAPTKSVPVQVAPAQATSQCQTCAAPQVTYRSVRVRYRAKLKLRLFGGCN